METIPLEPVDALSITTLVDNTPTCCSLDAGPAPRPPLPSAIRAPARFLEGGHTADALRAEHGFSASSTSRRAGARTGSSSTPAPGPTASSRTCAGSTCPRATSTSSCSATATGTTPPAWTGSSRGSDARTAGADPPGVLEPPADRAAGPRAVRAALHQPGRARGRGLRDRRARQPSFLLDGSLLVTGEVDRTTDFERGFAIHQAYATGAGSPTR